MSVITIPCGEIVHLYSSNEKAKNFPVETKTLPYKFHGNRSLPLGERRPRKRKDNPAKFFAAATCDPLFDCVNLDDFQNDKKLQRNFEEVLNIHKMGFPVKIVKQSWFPGLICIPIFHCQRCLALWTQAAQVPSLCSQVDGSVYGRLFPISVTKCDLLTKLLNEPKPTAKRLCKQLPVSKLVKPEMKLEKCKEDSFGEKEFRPVPVAEFVDINDRLQKYRRKFMHEVKEVGFEQKGKILKKVWQEGSPVNDFESDGTEEKDRVTVAAKKRIKKTKEKNKKDETFEFDSKFNARVHNKSCNTKRNQSDYKARPSTPIIENVFGIGLTIASTQKPTAPTIPSPRSLTRTQRTRTKAKLPPGPPTTRGKSTQANVICEKKTEVQASVTEANVVCEKKPAKSTEETSVVDKPKLSVVFDDKLETIFSRNLDTNTMNSFGFQTLVEDFVEQEEKLKILSLDLTRAFSFSYFELLRR